MRASTFKPDARLSAGRCTAVAVRVGMELAFIRGKGAIASKFSDCCDNVIGKEHEAVV